MLTKLYRYRVHFIFGVATLAWFLLSVIPSMIGGQRFLPAVWAAIREVRPLEWVMMVTIWYSFATQKRKDEFTDSRLTQLGLSSPK